MCSMSAFTWGIWGATPSTKLANLKQSKTHEVQWATAKLGGNTVAIFMGLRLIASILASKLILGATIVKTGMQVGWAELWHDARVDVHQARLGTGVTGSLVRVGPVWSTEGA